jgi:predicted enzyme related to lactoylglutathione lyase
MKLKYFMLACTLFCASGVAAQEPPTVQYVGAVSIEASHDTKVLADWYQKFGVVDFQLYNGGYYGSLKTPASPIYIGIHAKKAQAPKKSSKNISVVFHVNDYNGYVSMLEKNGLKPKSVESDDTGHFAHYRDPDGNQMTVWGD